MGYNKYFQVDKDKENSLFPEYTKNHVLGAKVSNFLTLLKTECDEALCNVKIKKLTGERLRKRLDGVFSGFVSIQKAINGRKQLESTSMYKDASNNAYNYMRENFGVFYFNFPAVSVVKSEGLTGVSRVITCYGLAESKRLRIVLKYTRGSIDFKAGKFSSDYSLASVNNLSRFFFSRPQSRLKSFNQFCIAFCHIIKPKELEVNMMLSEDVKFSFTYSKGKFIFSND